MKSAAILLALCVSISAAFAMGHVGGLGRDFGKLGASPKGGTGSVGPSACDPNGLDFSDNGCGLTQLMVGL